MEFKDNGGKVAMSHDEDSGWGSNDCRSGGGLTERVTEGQRSEVIDVRGWGGGESASEE